MVWRAITSVHRPRATSQADWVGYAPVNLDQPSVHCLADGVLSYSDSQSSSHSSSTQTDQPGALVGSARGKTVTLSAVVCLTRLTAETAIATTIRAANMQSNAKPRSAPRITLSTQHSALPRPATRAD